MYVNAIFFKTRRDKIKKQSRIEEEEERPVGNRVRKKEGQVERHLGRQENRVTNSSPSPCLRQGS